MNTATTAAFVLGIIGLVAESGWFTVACFAVVVILLCVRFLP